MEELHDYIRRLREDFTHGSFDEGSAEKDPSQQFRVWLHQAIEADVPEVQAMTVSTATREGRPSSRIVYLREFTGHDYYFYTNYHSRKGREMDDNPFASLLFFWPQLQRQIRIEGTITRADVEKSDAYFNSRPYPSKVGAWASSQSEPLDSRDRLEKLVEAARAKHPAESIARPPHWGGYVLHAESYEFWQGRESRLHDRITYSQTGGQWRMTRLFP
jgi:pyridoxamine 5'-phosphate oxidase